MNYDAHILLRDFLRARELAPYANEWLVADATNYVLNRGHSILETHKLATNDRDHVARLLEFFNPPHNARVLDAGSGVGTVSALMKRQRHDLEFVLLNISRMQIGLMEHPKFAKVVADFHMLPFDHASFDAVMFNFSLGHGLLDRCIEEAARVLHRGGVLFIYDITSTMPAALIERMGYRPHRMAEVVDAAERHSFEVALCAQPRSSIEDFIAVMGEDTAEAFGLDYVWPIVIRFVKHGGERWA